MQDFPTNQPKNYCLLRLAVDRFLSELDLEALALLLLLRLLLTEAVLFLELCVLLCLLYLERWVTEFVLRSFLGLTRFILSRLAEGFPLLTTGFPLWVVVLLTDGLVLGLFTRGFILSVRSVRVFTAGLVFEAGLFLSARSVLD